MEADIDRLSSAKHKTRVIPRKEDNFVDDLETELNNLGSASNVRSSESRANDYANDKEEQKVENASNIEEDAQTVVNVKTLKKLKGS